VEEEDIVDELDGQSFADTRAKSMDDSSSHETSIGCCLCCTKKAKHELKKSVYYNHDAWTCLTMSKDKSNIGRRPNFRYAGTSSKEPGPVLE
jgi:ribosomal 30S subunit maturation factor RimM